GWADNNRHTAKSATPSTRRRWRWRRRKSESYRNNGQPGLSKKVDPKQNGEKALAIEYEYKMELDKNVTIGAFLAK
ncbi:MAG: hypothetical protein ABGY75_19955, partial [Gemmataceae bacterium]